MSRVVDFISFITILVSVMTLSTFHISCSKKEELKVLFFNKSAKGVVRFDSLDNNTYLVFRGSDTFNFEAIYFQNWEDVYEIRVLNRFATGFDSDTLFFNSKNINKDQLRNGKSGELIFILDLNSSDLFFGDYKFQIYNTERKQVIKEFDVSIDHTGE
jgi:hypothetical protein